MIVVADTSPLNYLVLLGRVDLLQTAYGRVFVPSAVLTEMLHPLTPRVVREWAQNPPAWIERVQVTRLHPSLPARLGKGEREAISFAIELPADLLLMDEQLGREVATSRDIEVTGTLVVLMRGSLSGSFAFPDELERLRAAGFRVSRGLASFMLEEYDRLKQRLDRA